MVSFRSDLAQTGLNCSAVGLSRIRRSAEFHSAVSPSSTRPAARQIPTPASFERPADWKSAIQQSGTLRYRTESAFSPLTKVRRFLWLGVLLLAPLAAHSADPLTLLDPWFASQTNLRTWSADLVQTRALKVLAQPLVSTGRVWVAIPDRFRWELGQPAQTIALRQPDTLFVIYPRLKRAEKYPLNDQQPGPWRDALALLEASFPRSRADLESRFRVLSLTPTNSNWQLALQPKSPLARRMMSEIQITFRSNDFSLTATELKFGDGSSLRNDFINTVANPTLDPSLFDAKLEPGYTVAEPLRH
jgi:outer membrane lipoprotein-sorting protein